MQSFESTMEYLKKNAIYDDNVIGCFMHNYCNRRVCGAYQGSGCKDAARCKHLVGILEKWRTTMNKDIYKAKGYKDRGEYLDSLAEEYGVDKMAVYGLAELLGPNEDFDGLVNALEEM